MTISRRKFLGRSSVLSVAALLPLTVRARANAGSSSLANGLELLGRLTRESFAENLNTTFEVQVSAMNIQQLELISVSKKTRSKHYEMFDLVFAGKGNQFGQGTYLVEHRVLGSFPMFVVPIGSGKAGASYQAVFTRLS